MENKKDQSTPNKYRFIRRTISSYSYSHSSTFAQKLAVYTKMRRIYFRKVHYESDTKKKEWYYYSKQKQLKSLITFEFPLFSESYERKIVKHLKNLKHIQITLKPGSSIKSLISLLKKISKNVKIVTLFIATINIGGNPANIQNLYRNLCNFRKLRSLKMGLSSNPEIEYKFINKYIPRLNNLKELTARTSHTNITGLQRFMSQVQECPSMTGLVLFLEPNYRPRGKGKDQSDRIPETLRFHLFPNLTRLNIHASVHPNERVKRVYLDPSIREGLKSLIQLKEFTFRTDRIVDNMNFLFEGLPHLPLLDHFYMSAYGIGNSEEVSLIEFLQRQTQLISFKFYMSDSFQSRTRFDEHNRHLELICQSLKDMSRLKYLGIRSDLASLENFSRGLSHVGWGNQLKTLDISGFEDILTPSSPENNNKIKGLCDFIERQKLSLHSLWISIGCAKEDEIVDSLIRTIGETDKLKLLSLSVNHQYSDSSLENNRLFQDIPRESLKGYPSFNHTFTCLSQVLPRLKHLTNLDLCLNPLLFPFQVPMIDSSAIFNILPSLKNLGSLSLCLPFLKESSRSHPERLLQQLSKMQTLIKCEIRTALPQKKIEESDDDDWKFWNMDLSEYEEKTEEKPEEIKEIEEALKQTGQQRYFRQHLIF